ncbi:MAG: ATP-binding cassette domain-containing protein [Candidatus Competibacteraceae bacterium]
MLIRAVSRVYDDGTRRDEYRWVRKEGIHRVLLGPSGAGKSTLMNMVNGVVIPTAGRLTVGGIELNRKTRNAIQRKVGMIHQQLHLVPRLSVLHNVLSGVLPQVGLWRCLSKAFPAEYQRQACRLLHEVGMEEKHLYRRLSPFRVDNSSGSPLPERFCRDGSGARR